MVRITSRLWLALVIALAVNLLAQSSFGQELFYKGKTIRLIAGAPPGGGFDAYSRAITRPGIEFSAPKFEFLGVPAQDNFMIGIAKNTGITSVEQWIASGTVLKIGGIAPGGGTDDIPRLLKATLGLPLQLVTGYKGTGPVRLAFNAGEVHGICNSIESFKANWRNEMDNGEIVMVVQAAIRPHPEFPNLPWAVDLAKTDDAKKLIQTLGRVNGVTNRPYVMPPGTPKERVKILRKAFMDTMKDAEFIADTKRARLDLDPLDGETIDKEIKTLFKLEPGLVKQLKEILK
jgi:tripartite-type tricarboxylate transporter receptor subunit TctC